MSENIPTTPTQEEPKKSPRDNSLQDTKQANEIAYTGRLIEIIRTNATLRAELARLGFDDSEVAKGTALHDCAFQKYTERQMLLAVSSQDKDARDALAASAEHELSSYRQTVQALYKGAERTTLGASGQIPNDLEVFETTARAAYTAAQKEPYASKLATRGFTPERNAAALAELDQFARASSKSKASQKNATTVTQERNTAVKAMNDWVAELRKVAKANLRKQPGLLALLEE